MNYGPTQTEILRSAADVWNFLNTEGGLQPATYDEDLVDNLTKMLLPPSGKGFEDALSSGRITVEQLIVAFFQVVQPFAEMMSDLFQMYERAGARRSDHNLAVEFDFDQDLPPLRFRLSEFRDWLTIWRSVSGLYRAEVWSARQVWELLDVMAPHGRNYDISPGDPLAEQWVRQYDERRRWPDFSLPAPTTGQLEVDRRLLRAWNVWTTVVRESSRYGDFDTLRESARRQPRTEDAAGARNRSTATAAAFSEAQDSAAQPTQWPVQVLWQIESDYWARSFVRLVYHEASMLRSIRGADREEQARAFQESFDAFFAQLPQTEVEGEHLVQELKAFLSLPAWRRRYEIYSAWISTQIMNALDDQAVRVHQRGGVLRFSFSGTHLATVDSVEPRAHIWAELRSPLDAPVGKGRTNAIQPDYSLVLDPITDPLSSILVVECKQYQRPSTRNFAQALTDYARGRPSAQIVLVNYGRASDEILDRVHADVRHRTLIIGEMRPGSPTAGARFRDVVREAVLPYAAPVAAADPAHSSSMSPTAGSVQLTWQDGPADLDLHLLIRSAGQESHLFYSSPGSLHEEPWALLEQDVRHAPGAEMITIGRCLPGIYECSVHRFSDASNLAGCGAFVVLNLDGVTREFRCPESGTGVWWRVFRLHVSNGRVDVINAIDDQPW